MNPNQGKPGQITGQSGADRQDGTKHPSQTVMLIE